MEKTDSEYLREMANWFFFNVTPAMGYDQSACDRLIEIAKKLENPSRS